MSNVVYMFEEYKARQDEKGLKKYGQQLDPLDGRYDFIEMAIEEQVDGFQYLYSEKVKREHVVSQIREIIKYNTIPMVHDQIMALLDQLEGKVND